MEGGERGRGEREERVDRGGKHYYCLNLFLKQYDEALQNLAQWTQEGKMKTNTTVVEGFDNAVHVWKDLFEGRNVGKLLLKVA